MASWNARVTGNVRRSKVSKISSNGERNCNLSSAQIDPRPGPREDRGICCCMRLPGERREAAESPGSRCVFTHGVKRECLLPRFGRRCPFETTSVAAAVGTSSRREKRAARGIWDFSFGPEDGPFFQSRRGTVNGAAKQEDQ